MFSGGEDSFVSCADLDLSIKAGDCVAEGGMVYLLLSSLNTSKLRLMGGLSGIRGRCGG